MAKKSQQFRLEESFLKAMSEASKNMGITTTELVRNAINLYLELYERKREGKVKFYIKKETDKDPIEVIFPWIR